MLAHTETHTHENECAHACKRAHARARARKACNVLGTRACVHAPQVIEVLRQVEQYPHVGLLRLLLFVFSRGRAALWLRAQLWETLVASQVLLKVSEQGLQGGRLGWVAAREAGGQVMGRMSGWRSGIEAFL